MKTDITDLVQRYRLALRYIWNSCIWVDPGLRGWESVYSFRELKLPLFKTLVADPLGADASTVFGSQFEVMPNGNDGGLSMLQVNIRLPSDPAGGIWEPIKGHFRDEDVRMTLVDLFDWTPLGYIDFRYYLVLIGSFPSQPDRAGHHALVDVNETRVFWDSNVST